MKKIVLAYVLSIISSVSLAGNIGISFASNDGQIAQCKEMSEVQVNMLSQMSMKKQICLYDNYAQLTEKWTKQSPEPYIKLNSNNKDVSPELKEKLLSISKQCQNLAGKMREKLKEKYGVESNLCN